MEEVLRTAVRVVMEPALRLIRGDPHQLSERPCLPRRHVIVGEPRGPLSSALHWNLYRRALFSQHAPGQIEVLARRMDARPELRVTLLLNIQRQRGDTTTADQLVRRFADRFWKTD